LITLIALDVPSFVKKKRNRRPDRKHSNFLLPCKKKVHKIRKNATYFYLNKKTAMRKFKQIVSTLVLTLAFFFGTIHAQGQIDTTVVKKDSTAPKDTVMVKDTTVVVTPVSTDTTAKKPPKGKSTFIIYAGPNVSSLNAENKDLNTESEAGYHIGVSWRTKGFFYGQFGIRYNNPVYSIRPAGRSDSGDHKFSISALDFPFTGGINILAATDKVLNLRCFLTGVPSFNLGVGDNDYGYEKDNINTFNFYGQTGIGADFLFLVLEAGYSYGFSDLLKDVKSKPGQGFVNVGIRF